MNILPNPLLMHHPVGQLPCAMPAGALMHSQAFGLPQVSMKSLRLRKGKWLPEEEAYAQLIIRDYKRGFLKRAPRSSATLRAYLSEELRCEPMRITKKFAGDASIGKHTYTATDCGADDEEVVRAQKELADAEHEFKLSCRSAFLDKRSSGPQSANKVLVFTPSSTTTSSISTSPMVAHSTPLNTIPRAMAAMASGSKECSAPAHRVAAPTAAMFNAMTKPSFMFNGMMPHATTTSARPFLGMPAMHMTPSVMANMVGAMKAGLAKTPAKAVTVPKNASPGHPSVKTTAPIEIPVLGQKRQLDSTSQNLPLKAEQAARSSPDSVSQKPGSPSEADCSLLLDFITSVNDQSSSDEESAPSPKKQRRAALGALQAA